MSNGSSILPMQITISLTLQDDCKSLSNANVRAEMKEEHKD